MKLKKIPSLPHCRIYIFRTFRISVKNIRLIKNIIFVVDIKVKLDSS